MRTTIQKIFFGKVGYVLLIEFLLVVFLTVKHYLFNELDVDDGKPFFNFLIISIAATGGFICLTRMRYWGGYRSKLGKMLLFYGLGMFAWAIGAGIWVSQYIFLDIAVPFPGWSDVAYIFVNPCFIAGFALFAHVVALKDQPDQMQQKLLFFLIPVALSLVVFYFVYTVGWGVDSDTDSVLALMLNFYYTGGDIVTLLVLLIFGSTKFNYLGERLRLPFMLALISLPVSYVADILFAYTTATGTYVNGGITDFFYATLLTLLGFAAYTLHPHLLEDK